MDNKYTKLVNALNQFNEAVQNFGKTLLLVKEHYEKDISKNMNVSWPKDTCIVNQFQKKN